MQAAATLHIRVKAKSKKPGKHFGELYDRFEKMEHKNGKPVIPAGYSGLFHIRVTQNGKRVWKSFTTIEEALTQQANIESNLDRARKGVALLAIEEPAAKAGSIADAAAAYLSEQSARVPQWRNGSKGGISPNTLEVVKNSIETFLKACADFGAVRIDELKDKQRGRKIMLHVRDWMEKNTERRKGKAAYTDGKKFTYIAQLLAHNGVKMAQEKKVRWDGDPGLMKWHEVPRAEKPRVTDVVYYTPEDLKAMWTGAGKIVATKKGDKRASWTADDIRDLMEVLTLSGMRDEEVQHLTWKDILRANGNGLPKFKVQDKPQYDWKPKNGERVVQPLEHFAVALRETLKARKARGNVTDDSSLVFHTTVNTPDQNFSDQIRKMMNNAQKAGYEFSRPEAREHNIVHNFRRTFATVLNSCYGLSATTVMDRIGDADLTTTQRYLGKVDGPKAMKAAFEKLPFGVKRRK